MSPDFIPKTIDTLGRRSAFRCSNPDCDKLTSGPNLDPLKVTSIGEAAHIYGARPEAARYRDVMTDHDRATISNAIWLCRDCHALVDKDPGRYPAELLILWREAHETKIIRELGKPGELLRLKTTEREMEEYSELPGFARLLIKDKPDHWEYTLTAELLEYFLNAPMTRAGDLRKGLYSKPLRSIKFQEFVEWVGIKNNELTEAVAALTNLLKEMTTAWGAPGVPGDPREIIHVCRLFGQWADRLVDIADEATFMRAPSDFKGIENLISTASLHVCYRVPELYIFLRSVLEKENPTGAHHFILKIDLPDNWAEDFSSLLDKGWATMNARRG